MKFNIYVKKISYSLKKYQKNFFLIPFIFLLTGIAPSSSIKILKYKNSEYIFIDELTKKFNIEQSFDIITQKGKLFYKGHYAIYNVRYSFLIIDNNLYRDHNEVIRQNGNILLPLNFAKEIIKSFFPDLEIIKESKTLVLKIKKIESTSKKHLTETNEIHNNNDKINFIVIDPGHGGKDPGAISRKKIKEKEITLSISKYLLDNLKVKLPGVKILLTRNQDVFIELSERTEIANRLLEKNKSGIFVSIHVNASISKKISGYETYFLSQNPTNEEARNTAALENNVVVLEDNKNSKNYKDLDYIEATMKTTQILKESSILANDIQGSILELNKVFLSRGVRKADFFVLRGVMMPAVLVEVGFITNYKEVRYLLRSSYQKKMAKGISSGIVSFIKKYNSGKTLITTK